MDITWLKDLALQKPRCLGSALLRERNRREGSRAIVVRPPTPPGGPEAGGVLAPHAPHALGWALKQVGSWPPPPDAPHAPGADPAAGGPSGTPPPHAPDAPHTPRGAPSPGLALPPSSVGLSGHTSGELGGPPAPSSASAPAPSSCS